ncbi:hypothetical protein HK097_008160, partial [Rhizophlyctis rosea]
MDPAQGRKGFGATLPFNRSISLEFMPSRTSSEHYLTPSPPPKSPSQTFRQGYHTPSPKTGSLTPTTPDLAEVTPPGPSSPNASADRHKRSPSFKNVLRLSETLFRPKSTTASVPDHASRSPSQKSLPRSARSAGSLPNDSSGSIDAASINNSSPRKSAVRTPSRSVISKSSSITRELSSHEELPSPGTPLSTHRSDPSLDFLPPDDKNRSPPARPKLTLRLGLNVGKKKYEDGNPVSPMNISEPYLISNELLPSPIDELQPLSTKSSNNKKAWRSLFDVGSRTTLNRSGADMVISNPSHSAQTLPSAQILPARPPLPKHLTSDAWEDTQISEHDLVQFYSQLPPSPTNDTNEFLSTTVDEDGAEEADTVTLDDFHGVRQLENVGGDAEWEEGVSRGRGNYQHHQRSLSESAVTAAGKGAWKVAFQGFHKKPAWKGGGDQIMNISEPLPQDGLLPPSTQLPPKRNMSISIRVSKDDIATIDVETSPSDLRSRGEKRRSGSGLRERVLDSLASKGYGALRGWMLGVLPEGTDDARKATPIDSDALLLKLLEEAGNSVPSITLVPPPNLPNRSPVRRSIRTRSVIQPAQRPAPIQIAQNLERFFPGIDQINVTTTGSASPARGVLDTNSLRMSSLADIPSPTTQIRLGTGPLVDGGIGGGEEHLMRLVQAGNGLASPVFGSPSSFTMGQHQQLTAIARTPTAAKRLSIAGGGWEGSFPRTFRPRSAATPRSGRPGAILAARKGRSSGLGGGPVSVGSDGASPRTFGPPSPLDEEPPTPTTPTIPATPTFDTPPESPTEGPAAVPLKEIVVAAVTLQTVAEGSVPIRRPSAAWSLSNRTPISGSPLARTSPMTCSPTKASPTASEPSSATSTLERPQSTQSTTSTLERPQSTQSTTSTLERPQSTQSTDTTASSTSETPGRVKSINAKRLTVTSNLALLQPLFPDALTPPSKTPPPDSGYASPPKSFLPGATPIKPSLESPPQPPSLPAGTPPNPARISAG